MLPEMPRVDTIYGVVAAGAVFAIGMLLSLGPLWLCAMVAGAMGVLCALAQAAVCGRTGSEE